MTFTTKKIVIAGTALLCALPFWAQAQQEPANFRGPLLNKVSYQTSVEKWAMTTTANVTANIDASLDRIGLADMSNHVLQNLNKIAPSNDWHITQFSRAQDKSGLETLHVEAEARLPATALAGLRDKAKAVTMPGEAYTVADIDFSPSLTELNQTHADARALIYNNIKQEITRLNQTYPEQYFFLNAIDFDTLRQIPQPATAARMVQPQAMFSGVETSSAAPGPAMPVNTKIVESATVVIASLLRAPKAPPVQEPILVPTSPPTPILAPVPTPTPAPTLAPAPAPTLH